MSDHVEPVKEVRKSKYVTQEQMQQQQAAVQDFMEKIAMMADSNQKKAEAELQTITNISGRLENVENVMQKLLNMITPTEQAQPAAVVATVARQKIDISEIASAIRDAATAYREVKTAYDGSPESPIDPKLESIYKANMANLFNRGMRVTTTAITRLLNKEINNDLSGPITKAIASDIVGGGSSTHEPVL